ncbi:MAG: efflux RND transporter periplasmic adaptor subunit [Deltaproteobacteria bacterium]|nr:efflux RND transporter periplasmic adaptor subunit [Deltaproteobacteria bacterium]
MSLKLLKSMLMVSVMVSLFLFGTTFCSAPKEGQNEIATPKDSEKKKQDESENNTASDIDTKNVKTQIINKGSLTESALANGVTKADHEIVYSAEVAGKIEYMGFELGDSVKKGARLARIDFQTLKAQAEQANSSYNLAKTTYDRLLSLRNEELISQQQLDESYSQMINAQAQMNITNANLSKSTIKATNYGIVAEKSVEKSEFVAPGTPLYKLVDYRKIILEAQVAESQIASLKIGSSVNVFIGALNQNFTGTLNTILPTADAISKTFTVQVKIDNPDLLILVGMSARLLINAKTYDDVMIIPQNSVVEEQGGTKSIFVIKDGKAEKRIVTLGPTEKDNVVLEDGAEPGETLIVMGQRDLIDGQPVNVIR